MPFSGTNFVQKEKSKIAAVSEPTEGTYVAPSADSEFLQPTADGFSITETKETQERDILTEGFTSAAPIAGKSSAQFNLSVECKASGIEGGAPDFDLPLRSLMGANTQQGSRQTLDVGSTTSVLEITGHSFQVGYPVVVLVAGAHHIAAVKSIPDANSIEIEPAMDSAPAAGVEVAQFTVYTPSDDESSMPPMSLSYYLGNEVLQKSIGSRVNSLTLSNFATGTIPTFDFAGEALSFDREDNTYAPDIDFSSRPKPALALGACMFVDGIRCDAAEIAFSIEHELSAIEATCSESGRIATRRGGKRNVTWSAPIYMDADDVSLFTKFKNNTNYSVFFYLAKQSSVAGEYDLGSIVTFYMPSVTSITDQVGDTDSIMTTTVEGRANGGDSGDNDEVFIGFV